jgi:Peptidase M50B-like
VEATQTPLSGTEAMLIGVVVAVVVILSPTWQMVQHFQVMAHEGMHGVVGSLSGRLVESIKLEPNATGGTTLNPASGPGYLVAAFAGYLGPSAFGVGAARFIQFGHIIPVLWVTMMLLALLLIVLKPSFGYITVPVAGILIFLVLKHLSHTAEILAAYVITWLLLLSGVRIVVQRGVNAGDAGILKDRTSIPRLVWFALWLAGTLAAVVIGARWMLNPVTQ